MIDELRKNIGTEIEMLREISSYMKRLSYANAEAERKILRETIASLPSSIQLINRSVRVLLVNDTLAKPLYNTIDTNLERVSYRRADSIVEVVLSPQDKEIFLRELSINESLIKRLKRSEKEKKEEFQEFKASRGYLKLSNRFFLDYASRISKKQYLNALYVDLKKANLDILFETYIAMIMLTAVVSFVISTLAVIFLLFFDLSIAWPFISIYEGNYLTRILQIIWLPIAVPLAVIIALYYYPSTEKSSIEKRINQELPFAVIHMSAISGSGIEPSEIFKIIGLSREYPFLRREIRKVLNQINLYGYDLVTALNNVSQSTPSAKLSELFSGLSVTITSGGDLQGFFEKRSETLLIGYRLEREKYTKLAETFMDIYISIVIAAPMILLLILIMISISGLSIGLSPVYMTFLIVLVIALINVFFLAFLHLRQPTY